MLIANSVNHALHEIATRERDILNVYAPGGTADHGDVVRMPGRQPALDPLWVAAPTDAYFVTADQGGRQLFTRDGTFAMRDGELVDGRGRPVLGYGANGAVLQPLRADAVDAALGFTASAQLGADGNLTYERSTIDPRTGLRQMERTIIGRVALARFAPGTKLPIVDGQHACAPLGVQPHIGVPGDGNFGAVSPFTREGSAVDLDAGLQRLQEAYLALDAIRAAGKAQGNVVKTTMDLLK